MMAKPPLDAQKPTAEIGAGDIVEALVDDGHQRAMAADISRLLSCGVIPRKTAVDAVEGVADLAIAALEGGKLRNYVRLMDLWLRIAKYADANKPTAPTPVAGVHIGQAVFVNAEQSRLVAIGKKLGVTNLFGQLEQLESGPVLHNPEDEVSE